MITTLFALVITAASYNFTPQPLRLNRALVANKDDVFWLRLGDLRTDQTSGITYWKSSGETHTFLIVDDVGAVWSVKTSENEGQTKIDLTKIKIQTPVPKDDISGWRKFDLEGITFDQISRSFTCVSEGRPSQVWEFTPAIGTFTSLPIKNLDLVLKEHASENKGLEAVARSGNITILGLEGSFYGDAYLVIVENNRVTALHNMTDEFGLSSITGADIYDSTLVLLDRNRDQVHFFELIQGKSLRQKSSFQLNYRAPDGRLFQVHSPEGITFGPDHTLWVTIDPWKVYEPRTSYGTRSDRVETDENYIEKVPMIVRFRYDETVIRNPPLDD
ncbi:MAG: esterase-like activity of phytase family protein [Candidatus Lindowbacteria bacterium]|nr:esterase-like activity of phytase family protein [Candidatus Lindowbacteria bacterium]